MQRNGVRGSGGKFGCRAVGSAATVVCAVGPVEGLDYVFDALVMVLAWDVLVLVVKTFSPARIELQPEHE